MSKIERRTLHGDRNQCPSCGEFFNSSYAFDHHRTGPFTARMCLTVEAMRAKRMAVSAAGYWMTARKGEGRHPEARLNGATHA